MPQKISQSLALAGGHLAVVVCGACYCIPDAGRGPAGGLVHGYGTITGADSSYGFFAPEVGCLHRAQFVLQDDHGNSWSDSFDQASTNEARLRLSGIVEVAFMSGEAYEAPQWRKRLVKSWAATMFERHPRAAALSVIVEAYDIPTMAAYRGGSRPNWQTVYEAQIRRDRSADRSSKEE